MIAIRTARRLRNFFAVIGALLLIVGAIALFAAAGDRSFSSAYLYWIVGVPAFVGIWFAVEWCSTLVLQRPFWKEMTSAARIILLVLLLAVIIVAYFYFVVGIRFP